MSLSIADLSDTLVRNQEGIWTAEDPEAVSYPESGHASCFEVEEGSFWFRHRNRCILEAVRRFSSHDDRVFMDVGGGNGIVALALQEAGFEAVLVEPGPTGARNARQRGIRHVVQATLQTAGFRQSQVPMMGMFDVVEHVEHPERILQQAYDHLAPNGLLFLTVPAYNWLWSREDEQAGHFRRYTLSGIRAELAGVGFETVYGTYFFRPLILPIFLLRAMPSRLGLVGRQDQGKKRRRDHAVNDGPLNRLLNKLLEREVRAVGEGKRMAAGASCLVVAKSPC